MRKRLSNLLRWILSAEYKKTGSRAKPGSLLEIALILLVTEVL